MVLRIALVLLLGLVATDIASAQRRTGRPTREIRRVDFRNFNYGPLCSGEHRFFTPPVETLELMRGFQDQGDEITSARLASVKYLDVDGDGAEDAFVVVKGQSGGSSGRYLTAFLYAWRNGRAEQIWQQCEENSVVALKGRSIRFTRPEWTDEDAHCCFSYITTDTWSWNGSAIALTSSKRRKSR